LSPERPKLVTIAASLPFAETLARGLIARLGAGRDPLALSRATIYLPTRRAARNFADSFARVLGGAAATHVKPSVWFLLVCSLGALGVTVAKRYTELTSLGADAVKHRPVMRWYRPDMLRLAQVVIGVGMLATYLMWALSESSAARPWHLASALPLAAALVRFGVLTARRTVRPVEDLITRDVVMLCCEAAWLILFSVGLYVELTNESSAARRYERDRPGDPLRAAPRAGRGGHPGRPGPAAA